MTQNRRIVLNIVATYGRSLYALVIGLFCGRWTLMALGQVDYGLMGVVGGLMAFIGFFNGVLSASLGRFFAFSVGKAQRNDNREVGLAECRRWFTVGVSIHTVVPVVLMLVGYPLGCWAIDNFLTIPADRLVDCQWVFRFVCISCFLSMVSVPLNAMYVAKQYIAELTIYSFVTSTLNVVFLYYMITHPGVWLAKFACWSCLLSVLPSLIISIRSFMTFPECRIVRRHFYCLRDIRELLTFAGWNMFGAFGNLLKGAGMTVLVNKMLGPVYNASVSVATTASGQTQTLAGSMVGAFMPAITTACGAGDRDKMIALVNKTCKFGAMLVLPLAIPLAIEIDEVMILWLKDPPPQSGFLCAWLMAILVLENMTAGLWIAISAKGKIAWYQFSVGICFVLTLPLAWVMMKSGMGICSVGYSLFTTLSIAVIIRLVAVKLLLRVSPHYWLFRIFIPIILAGGFSAAVGCIPSLVFTASFARVCMTTIATEVVLVPLLYFVVMDSSEREFFKGKVLMIWAKFLGVWNA